MKDTTAITQLLSAMGSGDDAARDALWSLIYDELRRVAEHQMADEAPGRTLQPTALVNEVYVRLMGGAQPQWASRKQFFNVAASVMRHIRIDDARKRNRQKRGGGEKPIPLQGDPIMFDQDPAEVLAVNDALEHLRAADPRKADVVQLRYFVGLTGDETAEALGLSPRTVDSDWRFARAWLYNVLSENDTTTDDPDGDHS